MRGRRAERVAVATEQGDRPVDEVDARAGHAAPGGQEGREREVGLLPRRREREVGYVVDVRSRGWRVSLERGLVDRARTRQDGCEAWLG